MASRYSQAGVAPFTAEIIDEFGGLEELLACLESLSGKLHRMLENVADDATACGEPQAYDADLVATDLVAADQFADQAPMPTAVWLELMASGAVSDRPHWN